MLQNRQLVQDKRVDLDEVLWRQNFDGLALGKTWSGTRYTNVIEAPSGEGRALRVMYEPTSRGSPRIEKKFGLESTASARVSFDVYFEAGFEFVRGGKLGFGLRGGAGTTGCKPIVPDGWSARVMWRSGGTFEVYYYHQDRQNRCGDKITAKIDGEAIKLQTEQWYSMSLDVKVNDIGAANGAVSLLLGDFVVANRTGIRWRAPCSGCRNARVTTLSLSTFYGGADSSWSPSKRTYALFDNVVVMDTAARDPAPDFCRDGTLGASGTICCGSSCNGKCGGDGCGGLPGGSAQCCTGTIKKSGKMCQSGDDVACIMPGGVVNPAPKPEPSLCKTGTLHSSGSICCGECNGKCGGTDCGYLPGGSGQCCYGSIKKSGRICKIAGDVACVMP